MANRECTLEGLVIRMYSKMESEDLASSTFWRNRRCLVTGHTGFKGSWLALWLCELGAQVTGLSLPPEAEPNLFDQLGLPAQELEVLGRELLRASAGTAGERPGGAALMPERAGDLLWLGLSPASVQALLPHLSLLPGRLPVNLNTAEATVLQAVLGAPPAQVQQLLDRRRTRPFLTVDEAIAGLQAARDMVSVQTQFFGVEIQIELGPHWQQSESALLQRQGSALRVLWRYG